jgi:hypothetical protein
MISALRTALSDDAKAPRYIRNGLRAAAYRFIGAVRRLPAAKHALGRSRRRCRRDMESIGRERLSSPVNRRDQAARAAASARALGQTPLPGAGRSSGSRARPWVRQDYAMSDNFHRRAWVRYDTRAGQCVEQYARGRTLPARARGARACFVEAGRCTGGHDSARFRQPSKAAARLPWLNQARPDREALRRR